MNKRRTILFDDDLALPDLAQLVALCGYDKIPASAWAEWDRLYDQRMQRLSGREASKT